MKNIESIPFVLSFIFLNEIAKQKHTYLFCTHFSFENFWYIIVYV